jgi:hypothetical protein
MSTNKKHSHHSNRRRISGEIKNFNFEVDVREKRVKRETNAFIEAKESKKREKIERANAKFEKYHLANRKKLKNRWQLEDEFTEDFPEDNEL